MGGSMSSAKSNDELIDNLKEENYIKTTSVERVFRIVDRAHFFKDGYKGPAYKDLAWKSDTLHLSAPCIYSAVMEALELEQGMSFLHLGSGTGYLSTMAGFMIGPFGINHGIELHEFNVLYAQKKLEEFQMSCRKFDDLEFCEPVFTVGNCLELAVENRLYDRAYCGAGCPPEQIEFLKYFIKINGILIVPVGDQLLKIKRVSEADFSSNSVLPVSFASLIMPASNDRSDNCILLPGVQPLLLQALCRSTVRETIRQNFDFQIRPIEKMNLRKGKKRTPPMKFGEPGYLPFYPAARDDDERDDDESDPDISSTDEEIILNEDNSSRQNLTSGLSVYLKEQMISSLPFDTSDSDDSDDDIHDDDDSGNDEANIPWVTRAESLIHTRRNIATRNARHASDTLSTDLSYNKDSKTCQMNDLQQGSNLQGYDNNSYVTDQDHGVVADDEKESNDEMEDDRHCKKEDEFLDVSTLNNVDLHSKIYSSPSICTPNVSQTVSLKALTARKDKNEEDSTSSSDNVPLSNALPCDAQILCGVGDEVTQSKKIKMGSKSVNPEPSTSEISQGRYSEHKVVLVQNEVDNQKIKTIKNGTGIEEVHEEDDEEDDEEFHQASCSKTNFDKISSQLASLSQPRPIRPLFRSSIGTSETSGFGSLGEDLLPPSLPGSSFEESVGDNDDSYHDMSDGSHGDSGDDNNTVLSSLLKRKRDCIDNHVYQSLETTSDHDHDDNDNDNANDDNDDESDKEIIGNVEADSSDGGWMDVEDNDVDDDADDDESDASRTSMDDAVENADNEDNIPRGPNFSSYLKEKVDTLPIPNSVKAYILHYRSTEAKIKPNDI